MQSHRLQHNINCQNRNHLANHSSLFASVAMQQPLRVGSDVITPVLVVRDLGIHTDANISMRSHVMKTTSACFAVLHQLRGIHRSVPRTVFQSLVSSLMLPQLDYCTAMQCWLAQRLQLLMNLAHFRIIRVRSHHAALTPITLAQSSGGQIASWPFCLQMWRVFTKWGLCRRFKSGAAGVYMRQGGGLVILS